MTHCLLTIGPMLITLIVVGAVVLILRLLIPAILGWFGLAAGGLVSQIVDIVLKAVILILVVVFVFELIACLVGDTVSFGRWR